MNNPTLSQLLLWIGSREFDLLLAKSAIKKHKKQLKELYNFDYKEFKDKMDKIK